MKAATTLVAPDPRLLSCEIVAHLIAASALIGREAAAPGAGVSRSELDAARHRILGVAQLFLGRLAPESPAEGAA
jgi:hypothetical protein